MNDADREKIRWSVVLFLAITFVASYALWMYVIVVPHENWAILLGSAFPLLAAIATLSIMRLPFNELGARLPAPRWIAVGWLLPVAWALVAYAPVWLVPALGGISGVMRHSPDAWFVALKSAAGAITVGALLGLPVAAGEEFGWRGFLLPNLAKLFGDQRALVLVGAVWALWHYPLILAGPFHGYGPLWFSVLAFTLLSINLGVIYGFFRLRSGSTWPNVVASATNGIFIDTFCDPITGNTALTGWLSGQFGIFLVIVTGLVAFWCWRRIDWKLPARWS